jgi:hypothetical protein
MVRFSRHRWFLSGDQPLGERGRAREREPGDEPGRRGIGHDERERRGDPERDAVEAIHRLREEALAHRQPEPEDDVGGPVLAGDKVGDPPGGERAHREERPEGEFTHGLALIQPAS